MSAPLVITPPASQPIDLEQARRHVRADAGDDDIYLTALIEAATQLAEKWLNRSLITQTLEMQVDGFWTQPLPLLRPPIVSMASVKYDDVLGDETTLANEAYRLVGLPDARLAVAYGSAWPTAFDAEGAVRVRYTAGYGAATAVPMAIRQAILLFLGHWFANRETVLIGEVPNELPIAAEALLSAYRIPVL